MMQNKKIEIRKKIGVWIEVIVGCMFGGKTEETLRRLKRTIHSKKKILIALAPIDNRPERNIETMAKEGHWLGNYKNLFIKPVSSFDELKALLDKHNPDILVIDEVHFFEEEVGWMVNFLKELRFIERYKSQSLRVIVSGLDMDYKGEPYKATGQIMAMAYDVQKLTAICMNCREDGATMTRKDPKAIQKNPDRIDVGQSQYAPYCVECYISEKN